MSSFRWLHLTDLHCGQVGQRHLWPEIRFQFFEDLEKLVVLCGPWDAVLFSGDLVQHGGALEFELLEQQVLGPLWERFAQLGCQPVLLTVPGNHDLQRPGNKIEKSLQPALKWLLKPEQFSDIADAFFDDPDSGYRQITDMALANYVKWAAEQRHRQNHPIATSSFPGDFSTTFHVSDKYRVGVLGLNTTFLQLDAGDYQGKLAWDVRQCHAVCEGDGPSWAKQHDVCLLMTHQGPEWFNDASRKKVYPEINPAGRFAVHQFGHMHAEEMLGRTFAGGPLQRLWQGPSLFGLKHYGHQHNEDRRHGYSACVLTFDDDQITLQRWPRKAVRDSVNGWRFVPDTESCILTGEATHPEIIRQWTPSPKESSPSKESPPPIVIAKDRTPQLLAAWHTDTQQRWQKHWSDGSSEKKPPYIETQSLRLLLESDRPERFLHPQYFRGGRGPQTVTPAEDRGEWGEIDRGELVRNELGSIDGPRCDLARMVITTDAGVGKTTTMQWLEAELNQPGASTAAFCLTFSHLPTRLDELLPDLTRRMMSAEGDAATSKVDALRAVEALRREGRLVLLLDALDQEPADGAAAVLVGQLLDDPAWRKCRIVISGRPHAIQRHWTQLFATDSGHGWQFVQVDEFTPEEQRLFLGADGNGKDRLDLIPEEAREILSTPRVLSYLRGLSDTDLHKIRTVGDVYWHSIQRLLIEGMQGSDAARRIGLEPEEPTPAKVQNRSKNRAEKLLAAIAFEMTSTRVRRADAVSGDLSSTPNFDGVPRNKFQRFRERLLQRLSPDSVTDRTRTLLDRDLDGLAALNNFIEQGFFDTTVEGMKELFWRNRSLQEFFTALWLSQYGTADDAALLRDWQYLPDQPESEEYYWIWRFVCAMHPDARDPESWLLAIEPIYQPGDGTIVGTRRSCEFIYRAWEPLQQLVSEGEPTAVALRDRFYSEFEAEILSGSRGEPLRQIALQFCDSLIDVPAGEFQMGAPPEKQGIGEELRQRWKEYLEKEGDPEERARQHISDWSFTPGKRGEQEREYWLNWYTEVFRDKDLDRIESQRFPKDETPLESIQKIDAFRLSRFPTLNAWYRLFSPGHGEVESSYLEKYRQISQAPNSPVIFVSWYDAWAFTLWARWDGHSCRLPREYEWEYVAKAGTAWDQNYWWGDAFEADKCNADKNVGHTTPPTAVHANPWQFEDILGNVWEWCEDWYRAAYDRNAVGEASYRVIRGGSWLGDSVYCRAACRFRNVPQYRYDNLGFRVAAVPVGGAVEKPERAEPGAKARTKRGGAAK